MPMINQIKTKVMKSSRESKLQHFYSLFEEGESVLDVGVSAETTERLPIRNYFLKNYRHEPGTYTGLGVKDLSGMSSLFPGKRFVQYPGEKFPFSDKAFDWVFSNAVIKHVGDDDAQLLFLNEMMRVANQVFFTTPNKYFPIESHTDVLLLHWHDHVFYNWLRRHRPRLTKDNLYLLSNRRLRRLLEKSNATSYSLYRNQLLGIPMTFTVVCADE